MKIEKDSWPKKGEKKYVDGKLVFNEYINGRDYFHTREDGSLNHSTMTIGESMTQQQFTEECDINNIMKGYTETGTISHLNRADGVYADLSEMHGLRDSLEKIQLAESAFNLLPAKVRTRFENDPIKFVEFCGDPSNHDEAISLGLAPQKRSVLTNDNLNDDKKTPASTKPQTPTASQDPA